MLTKGDIEDAIMRRLRKEEGLSPAQARKKVPELGCKVFLSDWELRRLMPPGGRKITVPANAIISPLSADWLDYEGVEIVRA